jgi:hypothetical protein
MTFASVLVFLLCKIVLDIPMVGASNALQANEAAPYASKHMMIFTSFIDTILGRKKAKKPDAKNLYSSSSFSSSDNSISDVGDSSLGDSSLGDSSLGDSSLGDSSLGDSSLGDSNSIGHSIVGGGSILYGGSSTSRRFLSCKICQPGEHLTSICTPNQDATCALCPAGTFSNTTDSWNCHACGQGEYATSQGSTVCTRCSPGSFS